MKTALILAAGAGTRMMPLTATRPKPLLPVAGRPMISWTIDALKNSGVKDIYVLIGEGDEKIREALGDDVNYITQEEAKGTANAIGTAEGIIDGPFICMNGDIVVDEELFRGLMEFYKKKKSNIMTVTSSREPRHFGVIELDKDQNVISITEKPEKPKSNYINAGIYVFEPSIFESIKKTKESSRGEYEITNTLQMTNCSGYVYEDYWLDVGKPWDLLDANEYYLKKMQKEIKGDVHPNAVIEGEVEIGDNTVIRAGAFIKGPVSIGRDCKIGPNCYIRPYTALGDDVHIGNAVEIKNSIIMNGSKVPHLSYIGDSIIGESCNFGAGSNVANLRFDDAEVKLNIKGEKESSGRRKFGCVVGDSVKTGINVSIMPGKKIGPNKLIAPLTVVAEDIE
jgi:bifunctional UDP-N-acetylglucosamine pyrophosphorylase/glucosamine-1-phosphate N-acetyltransferase